MPNRTIHGKNLSGVLPLYVNRAYCLPNQQEKKKTKMIQSPHLREESPPAYDLLVFGDFKISGNYFVAPPMLIQIFWSWKVTRVFQVSSFIIFCWSIFCLSSFVDPFGSIIHSFPPKFSMPCPGASSKLWPFLEASLTDLLVEVNTWRGWGHWDSGKIHGNLTEKKRGWYLKIDKLHIITLNYSQDFDVHMKWEGTTEFWAQWYKT